MWSQVGLRKHHYKQNKWKGWNSSWAISNPKRWCCKSAIINMPANLENSAVATRLEKVSLHFNPKKGSDKECSNHHTTVLISHASKVMLKVLQARIQCMWNENFQMYKLDLEKAGEPEIKLPNPVDHRKSKRIPVKHLFLLHWLHKSLWLCGSKQTVENS